MYLGKTLDESLKTVFDVNEALSDVQRDLNETVDEKVNDKVNVPVEY
jgi:hypothetical protein